MSSQFSPLSDDDVRQIALLIETLDQSSLDFLQLEVGDIKLTIGKGEMPAVAGPVTPNPATEASSPPVVAPAARPAAAPAPAQLSKRSAPADTDDTVPIVAPIMGRFYAKPNPGSPSFVSVGSAVTPDTTVALIEVMKVFNAVSAGVCGVITEVCLQDAEIVEYGQVMFRVRPAE